MKKFTIALLLTTLVPTTRADDLIAWGKVVDGLQLGLSPLIISEARTLPTFDGEHVIAQVHLRNVSNQTIRVFPSVYTCLAMGSAGACLTTHLQLSPIEGGETHVVVYQGLNHLRLTNIHPSEKNSSDITARKQNITGKEPRPVVDTVNHLSILLDPETSATDTISYSPWSDTFQNWGPQKDTPPLTPRLYEVSVQLVIGQKHSDWHGRLSTGKLLIDLTKTKP